MRNDDQEQRRPDYQNYYPYQNYYNPDGRPKKKKHTGLLVILVLICFLINALGSNWKITAGVLAVGGVACIGCYLADSSRFENLLPDVLGRFSLTAAFDTFATDHVFDLTAVALFVSLAALLIFLTVQVLQKRRWS